MSDRPQDLEIFVSGDGLLGLRFTTGSIEDGRLVPYEALSGDAVVEDGRLFRENVEIGTVVGPDGSFLLPVDTFDAGPFAALFRRTNDADEASDAPIDQLAGWSVELNDVEVPIEDLYRKSKIAESARVDGFRTEFVQEHVVHLDLGQTLANGDLVTVTAPGGLLTDETVTIDTTSTRSDAVHVNQVGFAPGDPSKIAILSTWLGVEAGLAENAQTFANGVEYDPDTAFRVVDVETGERVFSGTIELQVAADQPNTFANGPRPALNLAAADTWLMDFSSVDEAGTYVIEVEGIGTSYEFEIADDVWEGLFETGARGFYHQRSGIALEEPYTDWVRPASLSPADGQVAVQSTATILDTANSFANRGLGELDTFRALEEGSTGEVVGDAWGGWHDAGDWDRRTQHLEASDRMMELFETNPVFFENIDLNIPESGNAVPDLLDEALWTVDFFQRLQKEDGGVPGGIEGGLGPDGGGFQYGEASWANSRDLFVYAPDPWSSVAFAASAARAARLVEAYDPERAAEYLADAVAAFDWAVDNWIEPGDPRLGRPEEAQTAIDARNLAALELYRTTGDERWEAEFLATSSFRDGFSSTDADAAARGDLAYYEHQIDAAYGYLTMDESLQDPALAAALRADFLTEAETVLANFGREGGFATSDNPFAPYVFASTGTNPDGAVDYLVRAYELTGDERFLADAIDDANYALGMNPDNVSFVSGVGDEQVRELLIADAEALGGALPPGIVAYGNYDFRGNVSAANGVSLDGVFRPQGIEAIYPQDPLNWPGYESWQGWFDAVPLSEFTVEDPMSASTYLWGHLAQLNAGETVTPEPPAPEPPAPEPPAPEPPAPEPPTAGLGDYRDYEVQIGTVATFIGEFGTALQLGVGDRAVFGDGVVAELLTANGITRLAVDDPENAYSWASAAILSDEGDRSWRRIDTTFDGDGHPLERTVVRDDGAVSAITFADGVRQRAVLTDPNDARVWERIESRFDAEGLRVSSAATYDDGTTNWANYESGTLANVTRFDPDDMRIWDTIYTEFEDGVRTASFQQRDNGDVVSTFYESGVRARQVFEDGSDTRPWDTRTTLYDEAGAVVDVMFA